MEAHFRLPPNIDLLITVSDDWLAHRDRWAGLDHLRWRLSQRRHPLDLLLHSQVELRQKLRRA